ncbi:hypothetical protein WN48_10017 [Eufriesea mexicana]|uniref:Uncharacterized protein n=1 Tax=Eufriesea mexicana TaxID=516756 RepID=A0A310SA47_9HYME|nr:hypothetical protein WN48_10017 [Eufriesea mexicana]
MKKYKLGRALESVREDFRVGKHGAEWPYTFLPASTFHRRFVAFSYALSGLDSSPRVCTCEETEETCPQVTFAPVCNLFKAQCPLISPRYMLSLREIPHPVVGYRVIGFIFSMARKPAKLVIAGKLIRLKENLSFCPRLHRK